MIDFNALIYGRQPKTTDTLSTSSEMAPILRGAAWGDIALVLVSQNDAISPPPSRPGCPFIAVAGDDPVGGSRGPSSFPVGLADYIEEAHSVAVYSGNGTGEIYEIMFRLAKMTNRGMVIIQTQITHHERWVSFIRRVDPMKPVLESRSGRGIEPARPPQLREVLPKRKSR